MARWSSTRSKPLITQLLSMREVLCNLIQNWHLLLGRLSARLSRAWRKGRRKLGLNLARSLGRLSTRSMERTTFILSCLRMLKKIRRKTTQLMAPTPNDPFLNRSTNRQNSSCIPTSSRKNNDKNNNPLIIHQNFQQEQAPSSIQAHSNNSPKVLEG